MKTLFCSLFLALGALPAGAGASDAEEQLRTFATCAGRLSALMEWQWMVDGPGSEHTARQRAAMIDLIAATMPDDYGRTVLHWRISAKTAHRALLDRATFTDDPDDAAWALKTADGLMANCTGMLLS